MTNIIDGMDDVRFQTPINDKRLREKMVKEDKKMPMVLKNLKNGS